MLPSLPAEPREEVDNGPTDGEAVGILILSEGEGVLMPLVDLLDKLDSDRGLLILRNTER